MPEQGRLKPGNGNRQRLSGIRTVVLLYAVFASLWILLSDRAVAMLFATPADITLASTIKGWLFVLVTSLMLYGLMRQMVRPSSPPPGMPAVSLRPLLLPVALLAGLVVLVTVLASFKAVERERDEAVARLEAISASKVKQISEWIEERQADIRFVEGDARLERLYGLWRDTGDQASLDKFFARINRFRRLNTFRGFLIFSVQGRFVCASEGMPRVKASLDILRLAQAARARPQAGLFTIHLEGGHVYIDFVGFLTGPDGQPGAIVVLRTVPEDYLFPILQTWPVPSKSGEVLLARREGNDVLYVNDLRYVRDAALRLRLPLTTPGLLLAQVLQGKVSLGQAVEGVDYRREPVVGVGLAVPGTDWFLIAKIDQAEIMAQAQPDIVAIALCGVLGILVIIASAYLMRQRQELAFTLREHHLQAERLRALSLLDAIAVHSPDPIFVKDRQGRYLLFNPAAARIAGRLAEQVLGRDDTAVFPPELAGKIMAQDRKIMDEGGQEIIQETMPLPGGGPPCHLLVIKGVLRDAEGQVTGLFGVGRDVSELRQAEESIRQVAQDLATAQAVAHVGSWRMDGPDAPERQLVWSEETYRIFGVPQGEPMTFGRFLALIHPEDRERLVATRNAALAGEEFDVVYRIVTPAGQTKWVRGQGGLVTGPDGGAYLGVGAVHDITEIKLAEEERERLQEQLVQSQKMEAVGRLAGGVAHDFNNMLSIIMGYTDLALIQVPPNGGLYASLTEIQTAAKRSAELTRQLLAFARKQMVMPKVLDLNQSAFGMLKMLRRLIGEDIELVMSQEPGLWPVRMDASQIDQILANLCVNARDAISGPGKVAIATANLTLDEGYCVAHPDCVPGQYVRLSVSDTGAGMTPEVAAKACEPFFTTKELGQGTGLGLATVYGIAKQNQGCLTIESEPGRGTTVAVFLPRHQGEPESSEAPLAPDPAVLGRAETVLVVEDETVILQMIVTMLKKQGYQTLAASTPGEAIRIVESGAKVDLLLTDVIMPEMTGRELSERLVEIKPHLRCLYMSGYTADVIGQHGVLAAGTRFIQKPFSQRELAAQVRAALDAEAHDRL